MGNRTAKFISALVGSIIAGAPLAAVSQNAPSASNTESAAADCLASPKGIAPQGQHWYYRLERATKRQCWYLRAEVGKDSAKAVQTAQAATNTPTAASAAPQPHSVQDARAEYLTRQNATASTTSNAPVRVAAATPPPTQQPARPAADSDAQQPPVATRWPDASPTAAPSEPQPAPAPVAADAQPNTKPSKSPAPLALTGSLQMLLLVVGGALALAGVLASLIYRFAGGRARLQAGEHRRVNWDNREPQEHDDSRAPWLNTESASTPRAQQPRPIDFDAARPRAAQLAAIDHEIDVAEAHEPPAHNKVAELDKAELFNGEFEIEAAAPQFAADDGHEEEPADRDEEVNVDDTDDVDVITAMLERLAKEGPRLTQPSSRAGLADRARNQRGQSAARA